MDEERGRGLPLGPFGDGGALRAELGPAAKAAHIPEEHLPRLEAEVDFGDVFVLVGEIRVRAQAGRSQLGHAGALGHA